MTGPQRGPDETPLAPARRGRTRADPSPPSASDYTDEEVARGQSAAVLGALGRMQLRLDVLAREQAESLARVEALLERVDGRLAQSPPDVRPDNF